MIFFISQSWKFTPSHATSLKLEEELLRVWLRHVKRSSRQVFSNQYEYVSNMTPDEKFSAMLRNGVLKFKHTSSTKCGVFFLPTGLVVWFLLSIFCTSPPLKGGAASLFVCESSLSPVTPQGPRGKWFGIGKFFAVLDSLDEGSSRPCVPYTYR